MKLFGLQSLTMLLLTFLTFIISTAHAGCYSGGLSQTQPQKDAIIRDLGGICKGWLGGRYPQWTYRHYCWNFVDGVNGHYDLYVYNHYDWPRQNSVQGCIDMLLKEINNCRYGGDSTYKDLSRAYYWQFIVDPNQGRCP